MTAQTILNSTDFKRCEDFHGHVCPGLSIGYRAAKAGMAWIKENRAQDEEIVAIVETNACSADAVQVITGCTFGKGNFIFKDHGKMVLSLLSRKTGEGVRIAIRDGAFQLDPEHAALIKKISQDTATEPEREKFWMLHGKRSNDVLEMPVEKLFDIKAVSISLPPKAKIEPSVNCEICKEPVMQTKMETIQGKKVCRECQSRL